MSRKDKLIQKLLTNSHNFTFDELETLLGLLGYERTNKGRTSGSRVSFKATDHSPILLHKPHPRNELLEYQVRQILTILQQEGFI